jgi:hypothetical protein
MLTRITVPAGIVTVTPVAVAAPEAVVDEFDAGALLAYVDDGGAAGTERAVSPADCKDDGAGDGTVEVDEGAEEGDAAPVNVIDKT